MQPGRTRVARRVHQTRRWTRHPARRHVFGRCGLVFDDCRRCETAWRTELVARRAEDALCRSRTPNHSWSSGFRIRRRSLLHAADDTADASPRDDRHPAEERGGAAGVGLRTHTARRETLPGVRVDAGALL